MKNKIGIIVVSYHNPKMTLRFVERELPKLSMSYTLIIVNVASSKEESAELANACKAIFIPDDNAETIPCGSKYVIWTSQNLGYAKGNNKGVGFLNRMGTFTHFLFSNDDIEIKNSDILERLCASMEEQDSIGIVGPRIIGLDGKEQSPHDRYISPQRQIGWRLLKSFRRQKKNAHILREKNEKETPRITYWVCGAFMFVDALSFNKVGGFDKRTFLYYEEVILSERFKGIGKNTLYVPNCCVVHFEGGSSKKTSSEKSKQINKESSLVYYEYYRKVNPVLLMLYKLIC